MMSYLTMLIDVGQIARWCKIINGVVQYSVEIFQLIVNYPLFQHESQLRF